MLKDIKLAKKLWNDLGDIPVNENDELDEHFEMKELSITFPKGTDKEEVWLWFEEYFNLSVAKDLMFK